MRDYMTSSLTVLHSVLLDDIMKLQIEGTHAERIEVQKRVASDALATLYENRRTAYGVTPVWCGNLVTEKMLANGTNPDMPMAELLADGVLVSGSVLVYNVFEEAPGEIAGCPQPCLVNDEGGLDAAMNGNALADMLEQPFTISTGAVYRLTRWVFPEEPAAHRWVDGDEWTDALVREMVARGCVVEQSDSKTNRYLLSIQFQ